MAQLDANGIHYDHSFIKDATDGSGRTVTRLGLYDTGKLKRTSPYPRVNEGIANGASYYTSITGAYDTYPWTATYSIWLTLDTPIFIPFWGGSMHQDDSAIINGVRWYTTSAGSDTDWCLAFYRSDPETGWPGEIAGSIWNNTAFTVTTTYGVATGYSETSFSYPVTLDNEWYWLAFCAGKKPGSSSALTPQIRALRAFSSYSYHVGAMTSDTSRATSVTGFPTDSYYTGIWMQPTTPGQVFDYFTGGPSGAWAVYNGFNPDLTSTGTYGRQDFVHDADYHVPMIELRHYQNL